MERDGRGLRNSRCRALTALAVVLIFFLAAVGSARAAVTLAAGSASGAAGTTVSVPLTFGNDGTIAALQVDVGYDTAVATAGNPTPGSALGGHRLDYAEIAPGLLRIVVTPPADNALLASGELVTIPFQLNPTAPAGSYPVNLSGIVASTARAASGQAMVTPGSLTVAGPNQPPVADAGAPFSVAEGMAATLDGSASSDADGTIVSWAWTQTAGPVVTLASATSAVASFTAPQVSSDTVLAFSLIVTDDRGATANASVTVTVTDVPAPADTTPPVVTPPPDVAVEATALQTPVPVGTATATDDVDGLLTPVPDNTGPFPLAPPR